MIRISDPAKLGQTLGTLRINVLPMALLLMPYALLRHGWATWRERRAARARR